MSDTNSMSEEEARQAAEQIEGALDDLSLALEVGTAMDADTDIEVRIVDEDHDPQASVYGAPETSMEWECSHPSATVEYGDDDEQGECLLCGAMCDWHYVVSNDDGYTVKERVPHEWHEPEPPRGIIGQLIELGEGLRSLEEEV